MNLIPVLGVTRMVLARDPFGLSTGSDHVEQVADLQVGLERLAERFKHHGCTGGWDSIPPCFPGEGLVWLSETAVPAESVQDIV